jgi:hypothetical protein
VDKHETEKAKKGQEAQGSGRKMHDDDKGQPSDPVRSQKDESGARMAEEDKDQPAHGAPRAADPKGELPRFVEPVERAGEGQTRFKVRGDSHGVNTTRYVLAKKDDRKGAEALDREHHGLDEQLEREKEALKVSGLSTDRVSPIRLIVKKLPD